MASTAPIAASHLNNAALGNGTGGDFQKFDSIRYLPYLLLELPYAGNRSKNVALQSMSRPTYRRLVVRFRPTHFGAPKHD